MIHEIFSTLPELHVLDWILLAVGSSMLGLDKAGLRGVSIIVVPLFASYFGGKASASIVLPLLITGDIYAVIVYRHKVKIGYLKKLLPAATVGLFAGMILGNMVPDTTFTLIMGFLVLLCLILMLIKEFGHKNLTLPDTPIAHGASGFMGGLSSMMGNAAGPIMSIYLLSLNLPKEFFIGTGALFFFIINLLKLPIQIFVWQSLQVDTLLISLVLTPCVMLGLFIGIRIVKKIPDKPFRLFILLFTLIGTIRLFLQ